jgi:PAS domain-containing protein
MAQYLAALISAAILPLAVTLEQKQRLTDSLAETLAETRAAWGAIIAADARYRLVVDYATEMVMRVAPDGEILFASKSCENLSPSGKLTGTNVFALMSARDANVAQEALTGAVSAALYDLAQHWTYRLRHADGSLGTYDTRTTLIAPGGKKGSGEFVFVLRAAP